MEMKIEMEIEIEIEMEKEIDALVAHCAVGLALRTAPHISATSTVSATSATHRFCFPLFCSR